MIQGSLGCSAAIPPLTINQSINQLKPHIRQASFSGIISECPKMQQVFSVINKVAATDTTVLVLGESGTGKELIAQAIHKLSGRKGKIVPVNCGAIPEEILESELFGHEKGAFTGAVQSKIGRFQLADGGTIFLDEIGEMSPKLQVKLLRVLQERVVEPVGSTRSIAVNVRIVAATNKDLKAEVLAGRFREDLFYRLQVVPIQLPTLASRRGDVGLLARYFLEREAAILGRGKMSFDPAVVKCLEAFNWPGNIRELENLVRRLAVLADEPVIRMRDLPEYMTGTVEGVEVSTTDILCVPDEGLDFNTIVDRFETQLIVQALNRTNWNKKQAAELLQLNRTTLVEKIKKKGLEEERGNNPIAEENEPIRPDFSQPDLSQFDLDQGA